MAEAGNVVHEDDRKLFVGALPQVCARKTMRSTVHVQGTLYEVVFFYLKITTP